MKDYDDVFDAVNRAMFKVGASILVWLLAMILLFMVFKPTDAKADDTWVSVTVRSYHYRRDKDYNETWHGIGIEHGIAQDTRLIAGIYENSYRETSVYAGAAWTPIHLSERLHAGVHAGCVNGYEKNPCSPFVIPVLTYERKAWGLNFGVVPSTADPFTVLGLQLKVKID